MPNGEVERQVHPSGGLSLICLLAEALSAPPFCPWHGFYGSCCQGSPSHLRRALCRRASMRWRARGRCDPGGHGWGPLSPCPCIGEYGIVHGRLNLPSI